MSRSIRRQSTRARLTLGLAGLGCVIALWLVLFVGVHTDTSLGADVPAQADAPVEELSEPESSAPYVPAPHTSQAQAIERALEQFASLQNDPNLLDASDPLILDDDLFASSIDSLHSIAPDELLTSCVSCPELFPTGGPEQLFAHGGPMGVPLIIGGGSRSSSGGSGGGGGGSGGSGGSGSAAGAGRQASASSSHGGGSQSSGSNGNNTPHGDHASESNGRSSEQNGYPNDHAGGYWTRHDDPENGWLPPGLEKNSETPGPQGPISVPEPSVLLLTMIGLGSLAGTRRVARRSR